MIFVRSRSFICFIKNYNDGCIKPYYKDTNLKTLSSTDCTHNSFNNEILKLCYYIQRQHFMYLSTTLFHKWDVLVNHKVYGFNMKNIKLLRFIRLKIFI